MKIRIPFLRPRAFTVLELLISLVVIGILSTLAMVQFGRVQEKAYVATMQSDLRNFATARAIYIAESNQLSGTESSETSLLASVSFSASSSGDGTYVPFEAVKEHDNSKQVFRVAYESRNVTDWFYTVGHEKTSTRCTITELPQINLRIDCTPGSGATDFSFVVRNGSTEQEKIFEATIPEPDSVYSIIWEYGDGTSESSTPGTSLIRAHTYGGAGTYEALMTLLYHNGTTRSAGRTVTVGSGDGGGTTSGGTAPSASFSGGESSGVVGSPMTFTSTSTDPDGDSMVYGWSFGDGTNKTGASVTHTYTSAGTYSVTLTVTDSQAKSSSVSRNVTIGTFASHGILYSGNCGAASTKSKVCLIPQGENSAKVLVENGWDNMQPEWSPDGTKIAYSRQSAIVVLRADGSAPTVLPQIATKALHYEPSWSPDGRKLTFSTRTYIESTVSGGSGTYEYQLWVTNEDGSNPVEIGAALGRDVRKETPDWSPDGSKILYYTQPAAGGKSSLRVASPDGTYDEALPVYTNGRLNPRWSPDGSKILYYNCCEVVADGSKLMYSNADGSNQTPIMLPDPYHHTSMTIYPAWAPDGSYVLFNSNKGIPKDQWDVYQINMDGSGLVRITNNENGERWLHVR